MLSKYYNKHWEKAFAKDARHIESIITSYGDSESLATVYANSSQPDILLAVACKAVEQTLGLKPRFNQIMCAIGLCQGFATEMHTGEGKTLAAALAAAVMAKKGKVHIATVNDYLAKRDAEDLSPFYNLLGLKVAFNDRSPAWDSDIVYSSSSNLIFSYLQNELLPYNERAKFPLEQVIIDEIDFVLLDNANSQFSVSTGETHPLNEADFRLAAALCDSLKGAEVSLEDEKEPEGAHYGYSPRGRIVFLTEKGLGYISERLQDAFTPRMYKLLLCTLEARLFYERDRDYLVDGGRIVLINRENGRVMPNSQLERDLHSAIEQKEGIPLTFKHGFSNSLSYQVFFSKYSLLSGMSGTVIEARGEMEQLFGLPVVRIPTHLPSQRIDEPDVVCRDKATRNKWLIDLLGTINQPVLLIAGSEAEAKEMAELIPRATLLLNENWEEEPELVRAAGQPGTITISTNLSGRGTDIVPTKEALSLGGLFVICLGHYAAKRIDDQVKGRAGRQGQPGKTLFFVTLEDVFWNDADDDIKSVIEKLRDKESISRADARIVRSLIGKVQEKKQGLLESGREQIYRLDQVLESYRQHFESFRAELIDLGWSALKRVGDDTEAKYQALKPWGDQLYAQLVNLVLDRQWLIFKNDMEAIKLYMPLQQMASTKLNVEYARLCRKEFIRLRDDSLRQIYSYFISATLKT